MTPDTEHWRQELAEAFAEYDPAKGWRDIPGWCGEYVLSNKATVLTVGHTITRSNGTRYTVKPCRRRWTRDHSGLLYMKLARNGRYTDVYRHKLMAEVWGDLTGDQAAA